MTSETDSGEPASPPAAPGAGRNPALLPEALVIPRAEHPISRQKIAPEALKVLYRLYRSGYKAYLVGGSVRDLLLKRQPKDFDVVTDASPRQIKELFRNSRIIGRRFRVVHVVFGKDQVVEVSTFRRRPDPVELAAAEAENAATPAEDAVEDAAEDLVEDLSGGEAGAEGELPEEAEAKRKADEAEAAPRRTIIDENAFGTEEEDALRRDITINGLFYDIATFSVIDYVGGLSDLHKEVIRTIGDPDERFKEDPVRIIRAVRHAARTGFAIEPQTLAAIRRHHCLLPTCAPARVLEEFLRELRNGYSYESFRKMLETTVLRTLFPHIADVLGEPPAMEPGPGSPWYRFQVLDRLRSERGAPPPDSILLAHLMLPLVESEVEALCDPKSSRVEASRAFDAVRNRHDQLCRELALPRRLCALASAHIIGLCRIRRSLALGGLGKSVVSKSYFAEAFALYELDAISRGERPADPQNALSQVPQPAAAGSGASRRRRRRRRGKRPAGLVS